MNPLSRKFKMRIQDNSTPRVRGTAGLAAWPEQEAVSQERMQMYPKLVGAYKYGKCDGGILSVAYRSTQPLRHIFALQGVQHRRDRPIP